MRRQVALAAATAAAWAMAGGTAQAASALQVESLSTRADLVTGDDVLLGVALPKGVRLKSLRVQVDGRDVTARFARRADGRITGLVDGLRLGRNAVLARAGRHAARLVVTNHPTGGPLFAGRQVQPWQCTTERFGLGKPDGPQCGATPQVSYRYRSTDGEFRGYDPASPPDDVATTTTDEGLTVPYVVRVETGTLDRSIYQTAVLADPAKPWTPFEPQAQWNGKLLVPFGGSCSALYRQTTPGGVMDHEALRRGFAVTSSGLNTLGQNCNEVVSAEALVMQKERIAETLGPIRYTIGRGGSGGAIQQHNIAGTYPGLLQGIMPSASFMDMVTTAQEVNDCGLLFRYYHQTSPLLWANGLQRAAVEGHANVGSACLAWTALFLPAFDPSGRGPLEIPDLNLAVDCGIKSSQAYDPKLRPDAPRCDVWTYQASLYGLGEDGKAKRPVDNVGVQYGLRALQSQQISAAQFVDLNEKIGGYDKDFRVTRARMRADEGAAEIAYRTGRVTNARALADVAILDLRGQDNEEIHQSFYSYAMRAKLDAANGTHANQVIWTSGVPLVGDQSWNERSLVAMDRWLTAVERDTSDVPLSTKVIENRPADVEDECTVEGVRIDLELCRQVLPYYASPRIAAGGPRSGDSLQCALRPLARGDYRVRFTDAQWARLRRTFPDGVCDHRKPAVGERQGIVWPTFADGPGGRSLGLAPVSRRCRTRRVPGGSGARRYKVLLRTCR